MTDLDPRRRQTIPLDLGGDVPRLSKAGVALVGVTGVVCAVISFGGYAPVALVAVGAAAALVAVIRWPIVAVLIILSCQEYTSGSQFVVDASPEITIGYQLFGPGVYGLTIPLALLTLGAGLSLRRRGFSLPRPAIASMSLALTAAGLTFLLYVGTRLNDLGPSVVSTGLRLATPWVLIAESVVIATVCMADTSGRRLAFLGMVIIVVATGLLGVIALAHSGGAQVDDQKGVLFFDAATPMLAAGSLLAGILWRQRSWWVHIVTFLSGFIVLFSYRRSVWLAVIIMLILVPFLTRERQVAKRAVGVVGVGVLAFIAAPGQLITDGFARVADAFDVAGGQQRQDSAASHVSDITVGLRLAEHHPLTGLGVVASQPLEFVNTGATFLYVHNELLQDWLRLGLPGLLIIVLMLGVGVGLGVLRLGAPCSSLLSKWCALLALVFLAPLVTAPFLSTSVRWPVLFGFVIGVLSWPEKKPQPEPKST